jgi:parallel beta-helix repeat protein
VFVAKNIIGCSLAPGGSTDTSAQVFGIDLAAHSGIVSQNMVMLPGTSTVHTGIRATGDELDVTDNQVTPSAAIPASAGAFIGIQLGETGALTNDARAAGNTVTGCKIGITARSAGTVLIESNIVETGSGVTNAGILLAAVKGGQVQDNRVTGNGFGVFASNGSANSVTGNTLANGTVGVAFGTEVAPVVARNRIDAMASFGIVCAAVTGNCEIAENRVTSCGFTANPGVGILTFQIGGELRIVSNQVVDTGLSPDRKTVAPQARGIAGTFVLEASIENNYVGYVDPTLRPAASEDRALSMSCLIEIQSPFAANIRDGYPIQILGNKFTGAGKSALIEILEQVSGQQHMRFERVSFSNNWCMHYPLYTAAGTPASQTAATVVLFGRIAIVMGNHIKALRPPANVAPFAAVNFNGMAGPFVGNVTSGAVLQHAQFPAPQANFNMTF